MSDLISLLPTKFWPDYHFDTYRLYFDLTLKTRLETLNKHIWQDTLVKKMSVDIINKFCFISPKYKQLIYDEMKNSVEKKVFEALQLIEKLQAIHQDRLTSGDFYETITNHLSVKDLYDYEYDVIREHMDAALNDHSDIIRDILNELSAGSNHNLDPNNVLKFLDDNNMLTTNSDRSQLLSDLRRNNYSGYRTIARSLSDFIIETLYVIYF